MVDIITALSMHPLLENIELYGNHLHKNGCMAMTTLLRCSATQLQTLDLTNNEINDEGIDYLVPGLKTCSYLTILRLFNNPAITRKGWQKLATILEAPNSNIMELNIARNNIDEQVMTTLIHALINNQTLKRISLGSVTYDSSGEASRAFLKLLCDTSSINSTFLSNHTIEYMNVFAESGADQNLLQSLLDLNKRQNKKGVAMIKILQNHNDFNMTPFFEWEFKVLPLMFDWFERASAITMPRGFVSNTGIRIFKPNISPRKLSSIYQFIRGMPLLYVETYIRKELKDIKLKETQLNEEHLEIEKRRLELRHQQLVLDMKQQQFEQRKQSVKDRKESLLEKLAQDKCAHIYVRGQY